MIEKRNIPNTALCFAPRVLAALVALMLLPFMLLSCGNGTPATGSSSPVPPAASQTGHPVPDETYLWRPVAIGGGGYITGMDMDLSGETRVARTDVMGAYIWNRKTDRWDQLATAATMPEAMRVPNGVNEGVYEVIVAPSLPSRLYMALKGRLYKSDDAGKHWMEPAWAKPFPIKFDANSEFRLYGPFLAASPDDPNLVFFGTPYDGLWRSTDAGVSWEPVASVPKSRDLRDAPEVQTAGISIWFSPKGRNGQRRVFAASPGNGLFVADDAKGAFHALPLQAGPRTIMRGSFAPDGSFFATEEETKRAWVYRDNRWTDLTASPSLPQRLWRGVAADPAGLRIFLSDAGGYVWCSSNRGRFWWPQYRTVAAGRKDAPWLGLTRNEWFGSTQIAFDPGDRRKLWVASGIGPFVADVGTGCDFTITWESEARGIEEIVANDAVQPPGHAPVFAGWDFGVHVKPDLNAYSTHFGPRERFIIAAQQVDWSPSNPAFLVTNASDTRVGCCSEDGNSVMAGYSMDGGLHWTKFPALPQPPGTKKDDPWRMAFGSIAVSADSIDNIVWTPGYNRRPFYTVDRGKSWREVIFPGAVGHDTGSFAPMMSGRKNLAADRVRPGTFYMVHSGGGANGRLAGLWRTQDRGAKWKQVFRGEIAPNGGGYSKLRAVPGRAGHLFFTAGVAGGPDTRLRRSTDGGRSWQALDGVEGADDVGFGKSASRGGYPAIFINGRVKGQYGIWRSVDNARNWQRLADFPVGLLGQLASVEGDKDVFGRVYIGYVGAGWVYGEPAPCRVTPLKAGDDRQCVSLAPSK